MCIADVIMMRPGDRSVKIHERFECLIKIIAIIYSCHTCSEQSLYTATILADRLRALTNPMEYKLISLINAYSGTIIATVRKRTWNR